MAKYKVGDKMKIKVDLGNVKQNITPIMKGLAGSSITIGEIHEYICVTYYKCLENEYNWREDSLEPLENTEPAESEQLGNPKQFKMTREAILTEAAKCVTTDREQQYGTPENNFKLIADYWNVWLQGRLKTNEHITAHDVAVLMALLKTARIQSGQVKADNYIDLAGYVACGAEIKGKESEQA